MLIDFGIGLVIGGGGMLVLGVVLLLFAFAGWMGSGSH